MTILRAWNRSLNKNRQKILPSCSLYFSERKWAVTNKHNEKVNNIMLGVDYCSGKVKNRAEEEGPGC